jgi:hypothetical protein
MGIHTVASTTYSVNGGAPQGYGGPIVLNDVGPHTISLVSADVAGNTEAARTLSR